MYHRINGTVIMMVYDVTNQMSDLWAAHRYPYVAQAYQSDAPEHVLMLCSLGTGRAYRIDHL